MTVKKRIVSFLLALVMAASCVPTALAAGEGRMAVAVSTAEGVVIAPQYVDCAQGETVWQVLSRMEGHTFTQGADGFVTSIDGVVANYSRFDSSGGYNLESPAAEAGAFVFTDTEIKDMAGYCDMVCAMADYNGADAPVRRYAEAEYAAAESGLSSGTADYAALAQTLREKMDAYEKEVIGADKDPATSNNAFNFQFGRWNVIVDPYLSRALAKLGKTDAPWILLDGSYIQQNDGPIFQNRVKLAVRSEIDPNNDNNIWKGRGRFSAGFVDWRFALAGGMTGGSTL